MKLFLSILGCYCLSIALAAAKPAGRKFFNLRHADPLSQIAPVGPQPHASGSGPSQALPAASSRPVGLSDTTLDELAESLGRDPASVFTYVRDRCDYKMYYGYSKGPLLTYYDRGGNDFDLSALLARLLVSCPNVTTPPTIMGGLVTMSFADASAWLRLENDGSLVNFALDSAGIGHSAVSGSTSQIKIATHWVRVGIAGQTYDLNPCIKRYVFEPPAYTIPFAPLYEYGTLGSPHPPRSDLLSAAKPDTSTDGTVLNSLEVEGFKKYLNDQRTKLLQNPYFTDRKTSMETIFGGWKMDNRELIFQAPVLPAPGQPPPNMSNISELGTPDALRSSYSPRFDIYTEPASCKTFYGPDLGGRKLNLTYKGGTWIDQFSFAEQELPYKTAAFTYGKGYRFGVVPVKAAKSGYITLFNVPSHSYPSHFGVPEYATPKSRYYMPGQPGLEIIAGAESFQVAPSPDQSSIAAGEGRTISVIYNPKSPGKHTGVLRVVLRDYNVAPPAIWQYWHIDLPLEGMAYQMPHAEMRLDDQVAYTEHLPDGFDSSHTIKDIRIVATPPLTISEDAADREGLTTDNTYHSSRWGMYAIPIGFNGTSGHFISALNEENLKLRDAPGSVNKETDIAVLALHMMGQSYFQQCSQASDLMERMFGSKEVGAYSVGLVAQEFGPTGTPKGFYVDIANHAGYQVRTKVAQSMPEILWIDNFIASALEHGILEQIQPGTEAASTTRMLERALQAREKLYKLDYTNFDSVAFASNALSNYSSENKLRMSLGLYDGDFFHSWIVLPGNGMLAADPLSPTFPNWQGYGAIQKTAYFEGSTTVGMLISGGYHGGYSSASKALDFTSIHTQAAAQFLSPATGISQPMSGEPVNLATGTYYYDHTDLSVGLESPQHLDFQRHYDSGRTAVDGPLGHGWSHNWESGVNKLSDPDIAWGGRHQMDAATAIVAANVLRNLEYDTLTPVPGITRIALEAITSNWCVDAVRNNVAAVSIGEKVLAFSNHTNGAGPFFPPPGVTDTLTTDSGSADSTKGERSYTLQSRDENQWFFQPVGTKYGKVNGVGPRVALEFKTKLTSMTEENLETHLDYTEAGLLDKVTDPSGHFFKFSYLNGRITTVSSQSERANRSVRFTIPTASASLTSVIDADGDTTSFEYAASTHFLSGLKDGMGRYIARNVYNSHGIVTSQLQYGDQDRKWSFYRTDLRTIQADPTGGKQTYYFDEQGRTIGQRDEKGNLIKMEYDFNNQVTATTDPAGLRTSTSYDSFLCPTSVTYPDGSASSQSYDSLHRPTISISRGGKKTEVTYIPGKTSFKPKSIKIYENASDIRTTTFEYEGNGMAAPGRVKSLTDPLGRMTSFMYDTNGCPATQTRECEVFDEAALATASGWVQRTITTRTEYDKRGDLVSMVDENGNKTTFTYDNNRRRLSTTTDPGNKPLQYTTSTTYDNAGNVALVSDSMSPAFRAGYTYSAQQKPVRTYVVHSDASNREVFDATLSGDSYRTQNLYDLRDWVKQATTLAASDVTGARVASKVTYYDNGWVQSSTDAEGRTSTHAYSSDGKTRSVTDAAGWRTVSDPDEPNLRQTITSPFQPSENSGPVEIPASGVTTSVQSMNPDGEIKSIRNKMGQTFEFQYTGLGLLKTLTTPEGKKIKYTYDAAGQVTSILRNDESSGTTFSYYPLSGRMMSQTDSLGTIKYFHDAKGNVRRITTTASPSQDISFTYDSRDRLQTYTDEAGKTTTYSYYPNGLLKSLTYGARAGCSVTYTYNADRSLDSVTDWATSPKRITTFDYYQNGSLKSITRPNKTRRTYTYTATGAVACVMERSTVGGADAMIYYCKLAYDNRGQPSQRQVFPAEPGILARSPSMLATVNGDNRLASVKLGISGAQNTPIYDSRGNTTTGPLPDGSNMSTSFAFDGRNRLTGVGSTTYGYNIADHRTSAQEGTVSTNFSVAPLGGMSQVLYETRSDSAAAHPEDVRGRLYVYTPGGTLLYHVDWDSGATSTSAGTASYYHCDVTGSTVALSTGTSPAVTARFCYSPYGEVVSKSGFSDTRFLFCGQYGVQTDKNGLVYMRARYYNSFTCRFLAEDPIGFAGGMNFFAYANGDPIMNSDPSGLWVGVDDAVASGAGLLIGVAAQGLGDLWHGRLSSWQDYTAAAVGGAAAGETTLYAGPVAGAAAGGLVTNATRQGLNIATGQQQGWNVTSTVVETAGSALAGKVGSVAAENLVRPLANATKGAMGEWASWGYNRLQGATVVGEQVRKAFGTRTTADFIFEKSGAQYIVESKFGTSTLTSAQKAAQSVLGDAYQVERWGYDWVRRVGGNFGFGTAQTETAISRK